MDFGMFFSAIDLHVICLCFNFALIVIYFCKKRVVNARSRVFVVFMFSVLISTLVDIIAIASIAVADSHPVVADVVCKLYLLLLDVDATLIVLYIVNIVHDDENKQKKSLAFAQNDKYFKNDDKVLAVQKTPKFLKIIYAICWSVFLVDAIILYSLPIEYNSVPGHLYDYGKAIDFTFIACGIRVVFMFAYLLFKWRYVSNKTKANVLLCIFVGIACTLIQTKYPEVLTSSVLITNILIVMYFTIQNPDFEIINQLNEAKKIASIANDKKTDFLLSMSHEIRTPLNAVVGYTEILRERTTNENILEGVESIKIASNTLIEIVNGIIDISKIETNKLDIETSTYSIKKMYFELITLATSRLDNKPIDFRYWIDSNIPDKLIGDYIHVKQVILNILTNAIKYTDEGYVDFKINASVAEDYCNLKITVEDTGIGIKKENLARLFGKFDRLGIENKTTIEGTGLGLAITKRLVNLMGGKISVDSVYGKGSTFTIELKQYIDKNAMVIEQKLNEIVDKKKSFDNKTVLLVDENKTSISIISKLLEKYNVNVIPLYSGAECINAAIYGSKVDLIFMDDNMPEMSGVETFKRLKKIAGFNVPIVMFTANAITGLREKYIDQGFDEYMSKPINIEEFEFILNKFLG